MAARSVSAWTVRLCSNSGKQISPVTIAYMTYGRLNVARSNAILICHALSGDQFVASTHPVTGKPGWWDYAVGPGKPIDTDQFFVICANVIGGCMGTTGPTAINPAIGTALWARFSAGHDSGHGSRPGHAD